MKNQLKNISLILSIFLTFLTIFNLFRLANYGIDFSDEGFYLNWASYRYEYPTSFSYFGFLTGFIFDLVKEDIVNFRIFNICAIFLFGFSTVFINYKSSLNKNLNKIDFSSILLITTISFFSISYGLMTPNYNSLNFYGFCLISISFNFLYTKKKNLIFLIIYSVGFVLISLSKATSVIPLFLLTFIFLLLKKDIKLIFLLFISTIIASITSIYIFSGQTFNDILQYILRTSNYYIALDSGHDSSLITRPFSWIIRTEKEQIICFLLFIAFNIINISDLKFLKRNKNIYTWFFLTPIYFLLFLILKTKVINAFFLSIPITVLIIYLKKHTNFWELIKNSNLKLSFFNLMLPFSYSFGTNTNYWNISQQASIFYICASLIIFNSLKTEIKSSQMIINIKRFIYMSSLFTIILVNLYIRDFSINPYRQSGELLSFKNKTEVGVSDSKLYLSDEFSSLINQAKGELGKEGFSPSTPILDMTGRLPGFIYAIDGMAFAHPWIAGGYPGSNVFAKKILADIPKESFKDVWFLVEKNGERSLDNKLLLDININIYDQTRYKKVFEKNYYSLINNKNKNLKTLSIYKPIK